jgi:hypothetical protein
MLKKVILCLIFLLCIPVWANIQLGGGEKDPFNLSDQALSTIAKEKLNTTPSREPRTPIGFRLEIDREVYYIQPALFMLKSRPDEVCTPIKKSLTYRCEEGQRYAEGCHLMFFDAQGKWVGLHTIQIKEGFPHFCNAMPAIGVANKVTNELLITMQYFLIDGKGAKEISEIGSGWFRMTSLFRVKAVNSKIEVQQDDACLGNPNRIDNIPDARTALTVCQKQSNLSLDQLMAKVQKRNQAKTDAREQAARQKEPAKYRPWIASGFTLFSKEEFDIDGDGVKDAAAVLESMDKSIRRVVILKGVNENTFLKTGESDQVAFCEGCATSIRTSEDPFKGVALGKNKFTVSNEVQGGDHWGVNYSFAWSRIDKQWQLVSVDQYSGNLTDRGFESKDCTFKPPKDFGKIALENFVPDGDYLTPSAKKRCGLGD